MYVTDPTQLTAGMLRLPIQPSSLVRLQTCEGCYYVPTLLFVIAWDVEVDNRSKPVNSWDVEALPIQPITSDRLCTW